MEPQGIYESLCAMRVSLNEKLKERKEHLGKDKEWSKLTTEAQSIRERRKKIELNFDEENETEIEAIRTLKLRISTTEQQLGRIALEKYREGGQLELAKKMRNGQRKKIVISFAPIFQQMSLFP